MTTRLFAGIGAATPLDLAIAASVLATALVALLGPLAA